MTNLSSFSQNTSNLKKDKYPKLSIDGKDTLITFKVNQAESLAEDLVQYQVCDSATESCEDAIKLANENIKERDQLIEVRDGQIKELKDVVKRDVESLSEKDNIITLKEDDIKHLKRQVLKQKILKNIAFAGCIILPVSVSLLFIL